MLFGYFINKGKNGIKNHNIFHSVDFLNNEMRNLSSSIIKCPNNGFESLLHSFRSAPFYYLPLDYVPSI